MFGLGVWEIVVIAMVVVLVFGPSRVPELAKGAAEAIGGFKVHFLKAQAEAKRIEGDMRKEALRAEREIQREVEAIRNEQS